MADAREGRAHGLGKGLRVRLRERDLRRHPVRRGPIEGPRDELEHAPRGPQPEERLRGALLDDRVHVAEGVRQRGLV